MSQTLNYSWTLGSGYTINYDATVTISVSRDYGSDTAKVTASGSMHTPVGNGDSNGGWYFRIVIGSAVYDKLISSGYHSPNQRDYFSYSWNVSVGANGGTLSGSANFLAWDNNNNYGSWATSQNWSQSYGTKGASAIASATNVNLNTSGNATSTVSFTSYSSSFSHKVWATIGSSPNITSTSVITVSGGNNASKSATLTFGTAFITAIPNAKSGTATVHLTTWSGSTQIGSESTKNITLTTPSGINPSVSGITFTKVSALSSTYFSGKICTLIDKVQVGWTETLSYNSAINSRSVNVNNETLSVTTNNATTVNALVNYGIQSATVTITDKRGNSGSLTSNTLNVYRYFYPDVTIKYNHSGSDYKVHITGSIAYVGGSNSKALVLKVYKGESTTATGTYTLTNSISAKTGGTYDAYYPIDITQIIDTSYITDIDTDTYRFEVTATDSVKAVMAKVYSGITVMSLEAGGTGVVMKKPVTFEQGVETSGNAKNASAGLELLPLGINNVGGKVKFDAGASGQTNVYVDNCNNQFRILSAGSNIFSWDLVEPYKMYMRTSTLTSSNNLNDYTTNFMDAWCNNVVGKPRNSSTQGRVIIHPFVQNYYEYTSDKQVISYTREYVSDTWTSWKCNTLYRTTITSAVFNSYGCFNTGVSYNDYTLISAYSPTTDGSYSGIFMPFVAHSTWWIIGYDWNTSNTYTPTLKNSNWGSHPIICDWLPLP